LVIVVSENDENEDAEGCECGGDVTESFFLGFVHLSFAYRSIVTYFHSLVNRIVPLCELSHIGNGEKDEDERKKG